MSRETPITEMDLHAYIDGQLPADRIPEVEAFLAEHPDEARRLRQYQAIDGGLHTLFDPVLNEPVPARLTPGPRRIPWLQAAAVAGLMLASGAGGWALRGEAPAAVVPPAPPFADAARVAYVTYSPEILHPVEVPAEQQQHLVQWLSRRLGAPLNAPELSAAGFELLGGRLLPADAGPAAQFMYQDALGRRLTLYVRRDAVDSRETAFRFDERGGVRTFYWIDREMGYALSGEVDKPTLASLVEVVYRQLGR